MNIKYRFTSTAYAAFILLLLGAHGNTLHASEKNMLVSLVRDGTSGPGSSHGLKKILSALHAKGVAVETLSALDAAKGDVLIIIGLAWGSGPAAEWLKDIREFPERHNIGKTTPQQRPAGLAHQTIKSRIRQLNALRRIHN